MYIKSDNVSIYPCANRSQSYNEDSKFISEKNLLTVYNTIIDNNNYSLSGGLVKIDDNIYISQGIYFIRGYKISIKNDLLLNEYLSPNLLVKYVYLKLINFSNNCLNALDIITAPGSEEKKYNGCSITILSEEETNEVELKNMLYLGYIDGSEIIKNKFQNERLAVSDKFELTLNPEENLCEMSLDIDKTSLDYNNLFLPFNTWLNDELIFDDGEF